MLLANTAADGAASGAFNVATGDYITVTEIADLAAEAVGLDPASVRYEYTGGDRGWKGDVPVVRLSIERIRSLGWAPTRTSAEALRDSMRRSSTRSAPGGCDASAPGASSSIGTASSSARRVVDGRPHSIRDVEELELEDGRGRRVRRSPRAPASSSSS